MARKKKVPTDCVIKGDFSYVSPKGAGKPRQEDDHINVRSESWVNVRDWPKDAILEKHEGFARSPARSTKSTRTARCSLRARRI
jgi:hypothetical protein